VGRGDWYRWDKKDTVDGYLALTAHHVLPRLADPTTVYRNLAKLARIVDAATGEVFRLVEPGDGDTWRALEADLDGIARAIGTAGAGERQKQKHERERAGWRLAIDRQKTWASTPKP
jgi:hypothetical protein